MILPSQFQLLLLAALSIGASPTGYAQDHGIQAKTASPVSDPLAISIHYLDGLSTRSGSAPREIRYLWHGAPFSLLLTNTSNRPIHLWKPYSPDGDKAIRLEFAKSGSGHIGVARTSFAYTGGMGLPKTFTLAPGDSLVYQIDFASYWAVPFTLAPGATCELLVRAVYESRPISNSSEFDPPDAGSVWQGSVATEWEHVRLVNLSESAATKGGTPDNLCR